MRFFSAVVVVLGWVWCLVWVASVVQVAGKKPLDATAIAAKEYGVCMQSVWLLEHASKDRGQPLKAMNRSFLEYGCKNPQGGVKEWMDGLGTSVVDAFEAFDDGMELHNKNQKDLQAAGVIPNPNFIPDDPVVRKVGRL